MAQRQKHTGLSSGTSTWVKVHRDELAGIPEPPEEFTANEADLTRKLQIELGNMGLIEKTGFVDEQYQRRRTYKAKQKLYDAIQRYLERAEKQDWLLDCCNTDGFISHDEQIECNRCGKLHEKSEVRE